MSELSFLIELLLNHKLPKPTKDLIAQRIKDVESAVPSKPQMAMPAQMSAVAPTFSVRAPQEPYVPPVPVQVAQTPAAAAAIASREQAIAHAISGTVEKGRNSPRKF